MSILNRIIHITGILTLLLIISYSVIYTIEFAQVYSSYRSWKPLYAEGSCVLMRRPQGSVLMQINAINTTIGTYNTSVFVPNQQDDTIYNVSDTEMDGHSMEERVEEVSCEFIEEMTI